MTFTRRWQISWILGLVLAASLSGCASARMEDRSIDRAFEARQYDLAAQKLKKGWDEEGVNGRDSLLYILDLGLALHSAGKLDESTKYFLEANDLAVIKDYTSITKEGATLLTSENIKDYEAEDFENVLINVYLAMNYALEGNVSDALVEARRVNQKLYMMVSQGGRKYKQNAFARYLSAILYESTGDWNDAYVDYKNTRELVPDFPGLGKDLWRCAKLEGIDDDLDEWDQEYHLTDADHQAALEVAGPQATRGEIVVLYENGISPIKRPDPQWPEVPRFYPRYNPVRYADVELNGKVVAQTAMLDDIEATAIENLQEKWGGIMAKKLAGLVAKGAVGYGVAKLTHNEALGELTGWILMKTDTADVRSWNLLPRDLQMVRIPVDPGSYSVRVLPHGAAPGDPKSVQVAKGQKVFVDFRFMP